MISFATGILCALVVACGAYFAMQAGAVTMVDRSNTDSTVIGDIWQEGWFREPYQPAVPDGT